MSPMGDCDESTAGDINGVETLETLENGIETPNLLLGMKEIGTLSI